MKRYGMVVATLFAANCNQLIKNTNDQTPPQIEIKMKGAGGSYDAASSAQLSAGAAGQLELMCIVSDADGVKSIDITYSTTVDACTIQGSDTICVASYKPQPQPLSQDLGGDPNGKVVDKLPVLFTVKGPFTCTCLGGSPGVPYGQSIKVTCTGQNWSSDPSKRSAQKVFTINLQ